jgi:hypothetical protein
MNRNISNGVAGVNTTNYSDGQNKKRRNTETNKKENMIKNIKNTK